MSDPENEALEQGRRRASEALERRRLRRALHGAPAQRRTRRAPQWLLAEGDSWFDFPFSDVLADLEDRHGYEVESVGRGGDTLEGMAYGDGQLDAFARALEKLVRGGRAPRAVLLSGGGNDVASRAAFALLLDHARSPTPGLNAALLTGLVDERLRHAAITLLAAVSELCRRELGAPIPILVHGYDYGVPDGRGFWSGWGPLPGPWLRPGLLEKGYPDRATGLELVAAVVDRFNEMLAGLPALPGLGHVRHVDLRRTLSRDPVDYTEWWQDELHPSPRGFAAVAQRFAEALEPQPGGPSGS